MMTITHTIDSIKKINIHMICPFCKKDLFPDRKLLEDLRNKFQSTDLVKSNRELIKSKPENTKRSFSSECCGLRMIYIIDLPVKTRNVTEGIEERKLSWNQLEDI